MHPGLLFARHSAHSFDHDILQVKCSRLDGGLALQTGGHKHVFHATTEVLHSGLHVVQHGRPVVFVQRQPTKGIHPQLHTGQRRFQFMGHPQQEVALPRETQTFFSEVAFQTHQAQHEEGGKHRPLTKDHPPLPGTACAREQISPPTELQQHVRTQDAHEPNPSQRGAYF